jgi:hypothetical protein
MNIFGSATGISLVGNPNLAPGAQFLYNVINSNFWYTGVGLLYGGYIQGVTVNQCNFTNGTVGIQTVAYPGPGGAPALYSGQQLAVSNSQFNTSQSLISTPQQIDYVMLSSNLFIVPPNYPGINMPNAFYFSIVGNSFTGNNVANTFAIEIGNTFGQPGIISGNVFSGVDVGVYLLSNSSKVSLQGNVYAVNPGKYPYVNGGTGNTIGGGTG